jgi:2-dehydropantoate 2-reductase
MRIGVVGIGGVGGYYGGKLAWKYEKSDQHQVIFIARGEHLKAIQKNGLLLHTRDGNYIVRPNIATDNPAETGIFDLVFFCTKSYSLESSALQFSSCVDSNTIVIPLLNGVNSAGRLSAILPQATVISGSVYIISHIEKPGFVYQKEGPGKLVFGTDDESAPKYKNILDILLEAKIDATLTDKVSKVLWEKYMLICSLASLSADTGKTYGAIMEDGNLQRKLKAMMKEVLAVAFARGVIISGDCMDKAMQLIGKAAYDSKTSFQLDMERGRQMELDILTEYICNEGEKTGVPTPLHNEIYAKFK